MLRSPILLFGDVHGCCDRWRPIIPVLRATEMAKESGTQADLVARHWTIVLAFVMSMHIILIFVMLSDSTRHHGENFGRPPMDFISCRVACHDLHPHRPPKVRLAGSAAATDALETQISSNAGSSASLSSLSLLKQVVAQSGVPATEEHRVECADEHGKICRRADLDPVLAAVRLMTQQSATTSSMLGIATVTVGDIRGGRTATRPHFRRTAVAMRPSEPVLYLDDRAWRAACLA